MYSFFQSFFGRAQNLKTTTHPISVHARALPKTKPAEFSGSVGRYKLSGKVDATNLEVGKPFNLVLRVEGVGNIKTLKEPLTHLQKPTFLKDCISIRDMQAVLIERFLKRNKS